MSNQYIFTMHQVGKVVQPNNREILNNITLSFYYGAKIGILGINGSGKSTLLRIMANVDKNYLGEVTHLKGIKIGYLAQEPELDESKTVRENVEEGIQEIKNYLDAFNAISLKFMDPMSDDEMNNLLIKQGDLQSKIEALNGWELERTLERAADALRLPAWDADIKLLSGGEKRRVALCKLLLSKPDLLLLDEPTNHLDAESVAWLERYLQDFKGTVVAITHDRYFLDNVAGWILELDRGRGIPYQGNYTNWLEQKEERLKMEERQEASHGKTIKAELEWVRTNPKGRNTKSKARLARFEEISSREFQKRNETNEIYIPPGPRLGDKIVEFENVCKGFNDNLLIDQLSFNLPKGAVVGIIGPNGAGKSTFFKMIINQEKPDAGTVTIGETVQLAYVDQSRENLDNNKTVWEEVSNGHELIIVGQYEMSSRAYLGRFNFKGSDQQKQIGNLSGGERNRLQLAKVLKSGGNVLLLDEPTNDLDVETLRALEEAILNYPGCTLVISHDRWFLDRVATHILAFEGDSRVFWFDGNYSDYEENRKLRLGLDAMEPHRIKYRKLHDEA
ncbi:MAG: yjjK [Francisellaceae bacterium]|nr:yjjK [Francisellaceae bacterium]